MIPQSPNSFAYRIKEDLENVKVDAFFKSSIAYPFGDQWQLTVPFLPPQYSP